MSIEATITPSGAVLLYVDRPGSIPAVPGFVKKLEWHITLVGNRVFNSSWNKKMGHEKVAALIREAVYETGSFDVEWEDKPLSVVTDTRSGKSEKSVVKWATVHGVRDLYNRLLVKGVVVTESPPMHCTLLVQEVGGVASKGIGIYSKDDPYLSFSDLAIEPDPVPTGGRIVLPEDDEGPRLMAKVKDLWYDKSGPRYTRLVGLALRNVCETFRLDPLTLAGELFSDTSQITGGSNTQLAFVAYPCPRDMNVDRHRPGVACEKYAHIYYHATDNIFHYRILAWRGTAVDVCGKLRQMFAPVTTRPGQNAGGIVLPGLASLEDQVGLTDFMKGDK